MKIKHKRNINEDLDEETKIGEMVRYNDVLLECVKDDEVDEFDSCKNCYFYKKERCILPAEGYKCFKCFNRKDNEFIYYKVIWTEK